MGTSDTIVFLGPSLPRAEAERILPAEYLPPAAMGDIYRAVSRPARQRPRRIALIDGYFERMAAPWHKEILWALERGAQVYGASSMGALRAAGSGVRDGRGGANLRGFPGREAHRR
jgi:hypothetical protein